MCFVFETAAPNPIPMVMIPKQQETFIPEIEKMEIVME